MKLSVKIISNKLIDIIFVIIVIAFVVIFNYFRELISDRTVMFIILLFMVKVAIDGLEIKFLRRKREEDIKELLK